jgi:16S rRNA (cytidine1402-2'-O)-methyltransferase
MDELYDKMTENFKHMNNLYIVATPIGNLQDITLRALEILRNVDLIVCEDTRVTSRLLKKYEIKKPLLAINEFNEEQLIYSIINKLQTQNIALVSDAGTPLISDPGFRLVEKARAKGGRVIPIPGPSAFVAALSASGLPTDKFTFLGFLSKSQVKNEKLLHSYKSLRQTIILYESPHRLLKTLETIQNVFGDIEITVARELTKIYEEIFPEQISCLITKYNKSTPKGEFVLLISTLLTPNS